MRIGKSVSVFVFGVSVWLVVVLCCANPSMDAVAGGRFDGYWQMDAYGVTVRIRLVAPTSVETMRYYWFNASAEIVAIDTGPPHYVETVYFYNLSHLLVMGGSWSLRTGTNSYGGNVTTGFTIHHRKRVIISAASVNIGPGQPTQLTYSVGVTIGVETEDGTLQRVQRDFPYLFEVKAGEDAGEYYFRRQQSMLKTISFGTLLLIAVIVVAAYYSQKHR